MSANPVPPLLDTLFRRQQLLRVVDGQVENLPSEVQDGICSACFVPLVPGATMRPKAIRRYNSNHVVHMLGKETTKSSRADEGYECLLCGNRGFVPVLHRTQRKKRRRDDPSVPKPKPVTPPPQLPQPTIQPGMRTLERTSVSSIPPAGSSVSLFAMKTLLTPVAPPSALPSYMITAKEAPKAPLGNPAREKSEKKAAKPGGKTKPASKFGDKVKQELDATSKGQPMKFFM